MNLAETIGEPEQIFENKNTDQPNDYKEANLLNKWLGKEKPIIW